MPDDWTLSYEGYDPADERQREALCTLGNGYFATRGAAPETAAGPSHYPGTYVAGCYNRLTSTVAGRQVENEDIVNLPNWLPLRFRTRGTGGDRPGTWLSPDDGTLLAYRQTLDLRRGTLTRRMRLRDTQDRLLTVDQVRLVHMGDPIWRRCARSSRPRAGRVSWRWSPRSTATSPTRAWTATAT